MRRVLFLVKSAKTPSSRIRVLDLVSLLEQQGIQATVEYIPESHSQRRKLFRTVSSYDIVVLQKRLLNWLEFRTLRKHSQRLVFDFDDAIYCKNASPSQDEGDYLSRTRQRMFRRTVEAADHVIAANSVLAGKSCEYAPSTPVTVVHSAIDTSGTEPKTSYELTSPATIGWIGTRSTLRYLNLVAPSLVELQHEHPLRLKVIADEAPELPGIDVQFVPWTLEGQYREIASFDIGIMPLSWDPFSEGKAAYKLLQYLASGVPSVCSPVGMNREVAANNEFALTANGNDEFTCQLKQLLQNEALRAQLGEKGVSRIANKYSIDVVAKHLSDALNSLA